MIEYIVKVYDDRTEWYNEVGELHREDGPAVECADGTKYWFLNDKCHLADGPAMEYANGYKAWYLNGEFHREDGPAIEYTDGSKEWYLNGEHLSESEFNKRVQKEVAITMDEIAEKMGIPVELLKIKKD